MPSQATTKKSQAPGSRPIKIAVHGCGGRMGRQLLAAVLGHDGARLVAGLDRAGASILGEDLGLLAGLAPCGLKVSDDLAAALEAADVVIDFSTPKASAALARAAAKTRTALVIGTTGLSAAETKAVETAAKSLAILQAGNMSLGVNLLLGLVEQAARSLGPDYDIEVLEMHHRMKVDAPSGTALMLGRAAAKGRGIDLDKKAVMERSGITGARPQGTIGFATLRGGDVVGEHTVILAGPGERIELGHKAGARRVFAQGALRAAMWIAKKKPGLYAMTDVLGL